MIYKFKLDILKVKDLQQIQKKYSQLKTTRNLLQITFLIIFIYLIVNLKYEYSKQFSPNIYFRSDPLIALLSILDGGNVSIFLPAGVIIFFTLFYGRFFCGWICPLGSIFDIVEHIKRNTGKLKYIKLNNLKIYILMILMLMLFFNLQFIWLFEPMAILSQGIIFVVRKQIPYVLLFVISISVFFFPRAWCKVICPTGAIFSIFSHLRVISRKVNNNCTKCMKCYKECPLGIIEKDPEKHIKKECLSCFSCANVCQYKAVRFNLINTTSK